MRVDNDTTRHIKRRKRLARVLGLQNGSLYAKHREKFQRSAGYVRDGNLRHFVACRRKSKIHVKGGHDAW